MICESTSIQPNPPMYLRGNGKTKLFTQMKNTKHATKFVHRKL